MSSEQIAKLVAFIESVQNRLAEKPRMTTMARTQPERLDTPDPWDWRYGGLGHTTADFLGSSWAQSLAHMTISHMRYLWRCETYNSFEAAPEHNHQRTWPYVTCDTVLAHTHSLHEPLHRVNYEPLQMFDRFTNLDSVEHLVGDTDSLPVSRPIQFTLIPNRARTIEEASLALRHADHICTLLAHQSETIKNTCMLRLALIQHLFTEVWLPCPQVVLSSSCIAAMF